MQLEDREGDARIGRTCVNSGRAGKEKRRALNDEQRKAANARYHELMAENPGLKVTPARSMVAREFKCSIATIRRIVEVEYAAKK